MTSHSARCDCDLVGIAEIADMVGVTRGAVGNWARRNAETFPEPLAVLACGSIYDRQEVWRWLAVNRPGLLKE